MNKMKGVAALLFSALLLAGCTGSGSGDDGSGGMGPGGGAAWIGIWGVVTENGRAPAANGYTSILLNLGEDFFASTFTAPGVACNWRGALTADTTSMTWSVNQASGPPCSQALGQTRTAAWTLSNGDNTLTLDWTATAGGTLQVYGRL